MSRTRVALRATRRRISRSFVPRVIVSARARFGLRPRISAMVMMLLDRRRSSWRASLVSRSNLSWKTELGVHPVSVARCHFLTSCTYLMIHDSNDL